MIAPHIALDRVKQLFDDHPMETVSALDSPVKYDLLSYTLHPDATGMMAFVDERLQPSTLPLKQFVLEMGVEARTQWRHDRLTGSLPLGVMEVSVLKILAQPPAKIIPRDYFGMLIARMFDTHGPPDAWYGRESGTTPDKRGLWAESDAVRYIVEIAMLPNYNH